MQHGGLGTTDMCLLAPLDQKSNDTQLLYHTDRVDSLFGENPIHPCQGYRGVGCLDRVLDFHFALQWDHDHRCRLLDTL